MRGLRDCHAYLWGLLTYSVISTAYAADHSIASFTLINADSNQAIAGYDPIPNNAILNVQTLPSQNLNIRVNTKPSKVGSVELWLDSNGARVENGAPYALFSDNNGNYFGKSIDIGAHTVSAIAYTQSSGKGSASATKSVNFTVINEDPTAKKTAASTIDRLTLINADTDQVIGKLTEGLVIDLAKMGTQKISIDAQFEKNTGSVVFEWTVNGHTHKHIENAAPYAIAGNSGSDYYAWDYAVGTYFLKVTQYRDRQGSGPILMQETTHFSIENSSSQGTVTPSTFKDDVDLVVSNILFFPADLPLNQELPQNTVIPRVGENVKAVALVSNLGTAATPGSFVVRWSYNGRTNDVTHPALGAGETSTASAIRYNWNPSAAGTHTFTYTLDVQGQIVETSESNNSTTVTVQVQENINRVNLYTLTPGVANVGAQVMASGLGFTAQDNAVYLDGKHIDTATSQNGVSLVFRLQGRPPCPFGYMCIPEDIFVSPGIHSIQIRNANGQSNNLNLEVTESIDRRP